MKTQEHTATPLLLAGTILFDNLGKPICRFDDTVNIFDNAKENAEFIVRACNAYEKNQETIKELVTACRSAISELRQLGFLVKDGLSKITIEQLEEAIKRAEA